MIDYQWPKADIEKLPDIHLANKIAEVDSLSNEIEGYFEARLKTGVLLVSSGRAAISLLLRYYNINRSKTVFAPKWTSHCVWDVVTRLANPTVSVEAETDVAIAVHKWGVIEQFRKFQPAIVIEDSVDSIVIDADSLFPNNGEFEIFSLPKIIGSYTGGIIAAKDAGKLDALRQLMSNDYELAEHQSTLRLKYASGTGQKFNSWECLEHANTDLDYKALLGIQACLSNYELNKEIILERLNRLSHNVSIEVSNVKRLPPVLAFETKKYRRVFSDLMIRNKNFSGFLDDAFYKQVYLLPLHFGVSNDEFEHYIRQLELNLS